MRNATKHAHLTLFYMLLPPLIVNYVEHMLTCKERLRKRVVTSANRDSKQVNDSVLIFA